MEDVAKKDQRNDNRQPLEHQIYQLQMYLFQLESTIHAKDIQGILFPCD